MPPKASSGPKGPKKKKTMAKKAVAAYVKRAINEKQNITNRVFAKTGRQIRGQGAYSLSDLWNTVSTPFRHEPEEGSGRLNNLVRGGAEMLGKELTGSSTVGKYLGNAASWFTKLMGSGTYSIKGNTVMNGPDPAIATFKPNAATVISHREFIADVTGSTLFANTGYLLNPGNSTLFPWLSTLALNYEQYEWLGLAFEFRSTCAFTSATGNLGAVIMATDYDVLDADFNDKRAMEIADFSGSSSPVNSFYHFIECSPKQNVLRQMYVQQGNSVEGYPDDPRFSIPGRFQLGTQGMPSAFIIGELWVTYHVKFTKPTIAPSLSSAQGTWARFQAVVLPSVTTLPVTLAFTGGTVNMGVVSPWTKPPETYVTGFTFKNFQPGNYLATVVSKLTVGDLGSTVSVGAIIYEGGATAYNTAYNGALALNAENIDSRGTSVNGYTDTKSGAISFTIEASSDTVNFPFTLWDLRNNGVTIIVTKLSNSLSKKKSLIDQKIEMAVNAALCAHGKDEVQTGRFCPQLSVVEEADEASPTNGLGEYCMPKLTRQDATSGLQSSSSRSSSNKK